MVVSLRWCKVDQHRKCDQRYHQVGGQLSGSPTYFRNYVSRGTWLGGQLSLGNSTFLLIKVFSKSKSFPVTIFLKVKIIPGHNRSGTSCEWSLCSWEMVCMRRWVLSQYFLIFYLGETLLGRRFFLTNKFYLTQENTFHFPTKHTQSIVSLYCKLLISHSYLPD